jgi:ABC-type multidrug transport system fused ATPase/permease subunit
MSANAWRHGLRIVAARPLTFAVYLAHYLVFYTLPLASGLILRAVFDALSGRAPAGPNVWSLVALMAGVEVARLVVIYSTVRFGQGFHLGLASLMRGAMLNWLVSGPGARAAVGSAGEVVSRFRDDVEAMDDFMEAWIDLSGEMLLCLGALAIMFSINAAITTAVVLPLIAIVTLTDRLTGRIQRLRAASRETGAQVAGFIAEAFGAVQTLQVAVAEDRVVAHLDGLNAARRRAALSDRLLSAIMEGLAANIAGVGMGLVLLLAAAAMRRGAFSVGDFALFASYVGLAGGGPRWIGRILARRRQAEVSILRMQALMSGAEPLALTSPTSREPNLVPAAPLQSFTVRGLSYRFPGSERGVADIDLTLVKGGFTVITGPVGAGKTTLLRCLLGLLPSDAGEIRWNGAPVDDPASFMIPPRCAYTPQAPRLFSETVRDNVALGHAASDAEIAVAVERAVLDGDVARLGGLDTLVGARGVTLSGGQIQRLAAARMFVRGAELTVFDDLSSALDVETEQRLWQGLSDRGDQTVLAVSHRREAFRRADQILVMAHGRIVARGTYEALLAAESIPSPLAGEGGPEGIG